MFVINANNGQEIVSQADYITNSQNVVTAVANYWSIIWYWIDATNKYIYIVSPQTASPWLTIKRHTYDSGVVWSGVTMTLSGFWTFASQPTFYLLQWANNWNFYLYCTAAGWSGSFATLTIYPVTISGTTVTLWTANTLPVVASYTIRNIFVKWAVIYAFYGLTAGPNTMDVWRKYSGSWANLSGGGLLTSIWAFTDSSGTLAGQTRMPAWSSYQYYYYFNSSGGGARFNTSTDTWENDSRIISWNMFPDTSGILFANWQIIATDDTASAGFTGLAYGIMPSDITNWLFVSTNSGWAYYFGWAVIWDNRRIRRIHSWAQDTTLWMIYSLDWWTTWRVLRYTTTMISDNYNLNYFWDVICIAHRPNWTASIIVEIA